MGHYTAATDQLGCTCLWKVGVQQERPPAHVKRRLPLEVGQRLLQPRPTNPALQRQEDDFGLLWRRRRCTGGGRVWAGCWQGLVPCPLAPGQSLASALGPWTLWPVSEVLTHGQAMSDHTSTRMVGGAMVQEAGRGAQRRNQKSMGQKPSRHGRLPTCRPLCVFGLLYQEHEALPGHHSSLGCLPPAAHQTLHTWLPRSGPCGGPGRQCSSCSSRQQPVGPPAGRQPRGGRHRRPGRHGGGRGLLLHPARGAGRRQG